MEKQVFKAESKRLLDLMIHSIYSNKEIFLRELISNGSDAIDKLAYRSLTDDSISVQSSDFQITLTIDKSVSTLTVADNGIGMSKVDMEENLGTIARSGSLKFKEEMAEKGETTDVADIIGQFGVGFYSAFMVADQVTVKSKVYGSDEAWQWVSDGGEGYTMEPCQKDTWGTEIIMHVKGDNEEDEYQQYLEQYRIDELVKKYSDYIRHPIMMEMERSSMKPRPEDAPEDYKPEYETTRNVETLNSMRPLWQRSKSDVSEEEYHGFYQEKFGDWEAPLSTVHFSVEGQVEYKALVYVPARASADYYSREFEKGLQLYSAGVLIMEKCPDLVPDCFSFVRGVIDSQDFSLNISREMLQQTRQLKMIATNLEKKIKSDLAKMMKDDRETYEKFFTAFGRQIKYGMVGEYGAKKDLLKDLLLFCSSKDGKLTSVADYVERMPEDQTGIYFLCAESVEKACKLPQAERVLDKGYEILCLTDEVDEFVMDVLRDWDGKPFKNVTSDDALPETDEEKAEVEKKTEENKVILDFVQESLGDKIHAVRISKMLKTAPVCLSTEGPVTLEMEKYFQKMDPVQGGGMKAQRVLELNADVDAFDALRKAVVSDPDKAKAYAELMYQQAILIAGLPLEDPAEYTKLVCSLMN